MENNTLMKVKGYPTLGIVLCFLLCLTLPNVYSLDCTPLNSSLTAYFSYDTNANDEKGAISGSAVNAVNGATNCIHGNCYSFDGSGDYIDYNDVLDYYGGYSFSVSVWYRADSTDTLGCIFCKDDTDGTPAFQFRKGTGTKAHIYIQGASQYFEGDSTAIVDNALTHVVYVVNYTSGTTYGDIYINGTWSGRFSNANSLDTSTAQDLRVGNSVSNAAYDFKGTIDELAVFNGTALSSAQIALLYNGGAYCNPMISLGGGTAPSLTLYSDLVNGTVTNRTIFNFYFNGSSSNNSNFYNCDIYADTTKKASGINLNLTASKNLSFTLPNTETYVNFTLNCYNENASKNLSALYYIDNIPSVLDWLSPNATYYNDVPLYVNFSITDDNIYYFEYNVYSGTTLKDNITHDKLHGISNYLVYNLSAVSQITGSYTWNLKVWENHNPLSSSDLFTEYSSSITQSKISYSDNSKTYVISSLEKMDVNTETRDLKQYFDFTLAKGEIKPLEFTYFLEYNGTLDYLPDSKYQGHFVLWDIKRYVDFVCNDYVKVTKISNTKYQINTPCTKFETTGNLNYKEWNGNFTITTPPSLSDEYLLSINETLSSINNNLEDFNNTVRGELSMLGLYVLLIFSVWVALRGTLKFFLSVAGLVLILIGLQSASMLTEENNYYFAWVLIGYIIGGILIFIGIGWQIMDNIASKKEKSKPNYEAN